MKYLITRYLRRYFTLASIVIIAVFCGDRGPDSLTLLKLIENWEGDIRIARSLAPEPSQHPDIVLITITEQTLQEFTYRSPIDRAFLSQMLSALDQQGVRGILVDLLFDQPTEAAKDNLLKNTIRKLSVPLVVSYTDNLSRLGQQAYLDEFVPAEYRGLAQLAKDEAKMTRWIYPGHKVGDEYIYGAASALAIKLGVPLSDIPASKTVIAWRGGPASDEQAYPFTTYAAHTVSFLLQHTNWLQDKIVLVGSEFDITDRHLTPFTLAPEVNAMSTSAGTPGVFIHANNLAQIMDGRSAPQLSGEITLLLLTVAALLGLAIAYQRSKFYFDITLGAIVLLGYWICGVSFFHIYGWMLPLLTPTLSFLISFMLTTMYLSNTAEEIKEEALEETRVKSEFLANMSHEIRSPMHTIIGMAELVLESSLTKTQQKYLQIVVKSAHSLLNLINDILDLSKLESGKMTIENTAFNLSDLLQETADPLTVQAQLKGLSLTVEIAENLPLIRYGDPLRLRQILTNLVSNAVKFTATGGVRISVTSNDNISQYLTFAIQDTGIGIPEDRQQAIFESFTQADDKTARKHGGTGLGTTIAKQIVGLMDGRIWLQSAIGKGSTFYARVRLPIAEAVAATELPAPADIASQNRLAASRRLNILLVDDIEENLLLGKTRLEQRHHRVSVASDGQQAVSCWQQASSGIQKQPFDVLLMDVQMPVMNGLAATLAIRQLESQQGNSLPVPIIAMTANAMKGDREKCLQAGMTDYISKPINFAELFQKIAAVVPAHAGQALHQVTNTEAASESPVALPGRPDLPGRPEHPEKTSEDWILQLQGIDIESGLVIWNQPKNYQKALFSFARSHKRDASAIDQAIQRKDWATAKFITHGLKGVAANMAANNLAAIAEEIDNLLLAPEPSVADLNELNQQLGQELVRVTDSLSILEKRLTVATTAGSGTAGKIEQKGVPDPLLCREQQAPACQALESLLKALWQQIDDTEVDQADITLRKLHQYEALQIQERDLNTISSHLDNFDFDEAKQALLLVMQAVDSQLNTALTEQD